MSSTEFLNKSLDMPQKPSEVKKFQNFHRRMEKGVRRTSVSTLFGSFIMAGTAVTSLVMGIRTSIFHEERAKVIQEKLYSVSQNQKTIANSLEDLAKNQQYIVDHQGLLRGEVQSVINYIKENGKESMKHSTNLDNALRRFIVGESDLIIKKIIENNENLMEELSDIMQDRPEVFDDTKLQKKLEKILERLLLVLLRQDKLYENTSPEKGEDINVKLKDVVDYLKVKKGLSGTTTKLPSEAGSRVI